MSRSIRRILAVAVVAGMAALPARALPVDASEPCDPLDQALCLLPFPNDRFTVADSSTATGRRVDFLPVEMPRSVAGKPIEPIEWNRQDGFSPGSMVLTFVPGLDLHKTWGTTSNGDAFNDTADHIADIGRYAAPDAPIVIIDATTGERWPFWSELDMNSQTKPEERLLIIRPAKNFLESHRYLVGLRTLRDANGVLIPAGSTFASYRSGSDPVAEATGRAPHIRSVIQTIATAEQARGNAFDASELFLAWDFTIASERNLSERVLHIRDDAFAKLGDTDLDDGLIQGAAPSFTITKITDKPNDTTRLKQVDGTITVPNYIDRDPRPQPTEKDPSNSLPMQSAGGRFLYGTDGLPMQNPAIPTIDVPFVCTIPRAATASSPAHPILYGHGLLGSRSESTGGSTDRDRERNFMPCATNWMGFAEYDIVNAVHTLGDPSNMPTMADRSQQGFLNWTYLARAIAHPNGLASNAAFQSAGQPLFNTTELAYDGNSQGGIMGGALCALSVDLTRCVLGVTGMNYSTLLNRSVDWEGPLFDTSNLDGPNDDPEDYLPSYSSLLYTMFPNKQEQQLVIGIIQMLWDRAEANGYAQHMSSDPLPNTPAHQVLMHVAYGDFQVANVSAEVEARTIGARVLDTALVPGRHWAVDPFFGLQTFARNLDGSIAPHDGSALVYWDSGNLAPPNSNIPPRLDGGDPHEDPRRDADGGDQKAAFWLTGRVIDVMGGGPYLACPLDNRRFQVPRGPHPVGYDWCP